jgi:hypothetical protein
MALLHTSGEHEGGACAPLPLAGGVGGGIDVEAVLRGCSPSPSPSRKREGNAGTAACDMLKGPRSSGQLIS